MRFLAQAPPHLQLRTPAQRNQLETIYDEIHYTASSVHLPLPDFLGTVVSTKPLPLFGNSGVSLPRGLHAEEE